MITWFASLPLIVGSVLENEQQKYTGSFLCKYRSNVEWSKHKWQAIFFLMYLGRDEQLYHYKVKEKGYFSDLIKLDIV